MSDLTITIDGNETVVTAGATVAAALVATGGTDSWSGMRRDSPHGIFCGMGICFECLATIDGVRHQRTCLVEVKDGMIVETRDR